MFRCQGIYCAFRSTSTAQSTISCAALLSAGDTSGLFIYMVQFIQAEAAACEAEAATFEAALQELRDHPRQVVLSKKRCAVSAPMDPY